MFQDEVPFFKVLSNTDLWKELRKWMYPNKKTSNIYNYRNGDIAAYYGYLSLIQHNKQLVFTSDSLKYSIRNTNIDFVKFLYYRTRQSNIRDVLKRAKDPDIIQFLQSEIEKSTYRKRLITNNDLFVVVDKWEIVVKP